MKNYRILINLILISGLLALGILSFQKRQSIINLKSSIISISRQITEGQQKVPLPASDLTEYKKYYEYLKTRFNDSVDKNNIYSLGQEFSTRITRHGLKIEYYNIQEIERPYLLYSAQGSIYNILNLLRTISSEEKYYSFKNLSIDRKGEDYKLNITFTPSVINKPSDDLIVKKPDLLPLASLRKETPRYLSGRLFYSPAPPVEEPEPEVKVQKTIPAKRINAAPKWLSYTGHGKENDINSWFFLDTRTNRPIEIQDENDSNEFEILEIDTFKILIQIDGEKYYVNKY